MFYHPYNLRNPDYDGPYRPIRWRNPSSYFYPRTGRIIVIPITLRPPVGRLPWGPGPARPPWGIPRYRNKPYR